MICILSHAGLQQRGGEMFCRQQRGGVGRRAAGVLSVLGCVAQVCADACRAWKELGA